MNSPLSVCKKTLNFSISCFFALFLPNVCVGCGVFCGAKTLCARCLNSTFISSTPFSKSVVATNTSIFVLNSYSGAIKKYLGLIKFESYNRLALLLSDKIHKLIPTEFFDDVDVLLSVPLHPKKYNIRGFNQVDVLFHQTLLSYPEKYSRDLIRCKNTVPLFDLSPAERKNHIAQAFFWNGASLVGKRVCVLDDIYTTGATFNEVVTVLKAQGADSVTGLMICESDGKLEC